MFGTAGDPSVCYVCGRDVKEECQNALKLKVTTSHDKLSLIIAANRCVLLLALASPHGDGSDDGVFGEVVGADCV